MLQDFFWGSLILSRPFLFSIKYFSPPLVIPLNWFTSTFDMSFTRGGSCTRQHRTSSSIREPVIQIPYLPSQQDKRASISTSYTFDVSFTRGGSCNILDKRASISTSYTFDVSFTRGVICRQYRTPSIIRQLVIVYSVL